MAIIQNATIKGYGSQPVPYPSCAGEVVASRFSITVPSGAAANDILEFAVLPPNCTVIDFILDNDAITGASADIGLMTGDVGSTDPARTCGNEFFAAQSVAAAGVVRMTKAAGFRVARSPKERSIGAKLTAASSAAGELGATIFYVS